MIGFHCSLLALLAHVVFTLLQFSLCRAEIEPWNLPVKPPIVPDFPDIWNHTKGKLIPRHLWMAFKDVPAPEDRKDYLKKMITKNENQGWVIHLADNADKLSWMRKYFSGTSVLWAYEIIHPTLGNSAADIWRYAVLWLTGGLYMDDDSYFEASFDDVIGAEDTLIMAAEKNPYHDDCFLPAYRLSAHSMRQKYNTTNPLGHLFGGRTVVSWAIFARARHPIMLRTLENIIDLIRKEYLRKSVVNIHPRYDVKWKLVMCTTGPPVLTASARELVLDYNETGVQYTLHKRDFINYGGVFKMPDNHQEEEKHYMHTMQKYNTPLLSSYKELDRSDYVGRVISSDGKELFLVMDNGTRRGFTDYDAFQAFHFHLKDVITLPPEKFAWFSLEDKLLTVEEAASYLQKHAN